MITILNFMIRKLTIMMGKRIRIRELIISLFVCHNDDDDDNNDDDDDDWIHNRIKKNNKLNVLTQC